MHTKFGSGTLMFKASENRNWSCIQYNDYQLEHTRQKPLFATSPSQLILKPEIKF